MRAEAPDKGEYLKKKIKIMVKKDIYVFRSRSDGGALNY